MAESKADQTTEKTKTDDKDAMLEGGQADYGSAGNLAREGVNNATPDKKPD